MRLSPLKTDDVIKNKLLIKYTFPCEFFFYFRNLRFTFAEMPKSSISTSFLAFILAITVHSAAISQSEIPVRYKTPRQCIAKNELYLPVVLICQVENIFHLDNHCQALKAEPVFVRANEILEMQRDKVSSSCAPQREYGEIRFMGERLESLMGRYCGENRKKSRNLIGGIEL